MYRNVDAAKILKFSPIIFLVEMEWLYINQRNILFGTISKFHGDDNNSILLVDFKIDNCLITGDLKALRVFLNG